MIRVESISNTGKATTTGMSSVSQLFVVVFAATVSLALPVLALAQQPAKPEQQTQSALKIRMAKTTNKACRWLQ